ncbi:alpha-amylase family protein [Arthrobacter sp. Br18]|uniref:alpha-amylase family protein n=1 Tax=Arthrobacter sp. Br18 TaxID=1312954 RepID=UPI00055B5D1E|nr:alpha-amylase family protein [Arthrobacter sp. Br18]
MTSEPSWVHHVIWWQVYPLGFVGAGKEAGVVEPVVHSLVHLVDWLDYAVELGASGLALGPIFASETHGYDTSDYFRVDPRLGDDNDFRAVVDEAHSRGLRVLLDGVFNHTGRSFQQFQDAVRLGRSAPTAGWFRFHWPPTGSGSDDSGAAVPYDDFEGHHSLVALDHEEPEVARFVADVMKHWLRRGADGWRLDAAYAVPSSFWSAVLSDVRAEFPDAYFLGEYIHGDYAADVRAGTLDSATQYQLWKAVWSGLNDRNFFELAAALDRHNGLLETFTPLTFVGNHDVTRLATRLDDPALLAHALVILFTVGGTPSIYYGDEQAFRGLKEDRAGGDDAVRPEFPASPSDLAASGWPVYHLHQQLIGLRRRHPWLHTARTKIHMLRNDHLVYEAVGGNSSIVVALNLSESPATVEVPATAAAAVVLAGDAGLDPGGHRLAMPSRGWAVLGSSR